MERENSKMKTNDSKICVESGDYINDKEKFKLALMRTKF